MNDPFSEPRGSSSYTPQLATTGVVASHLILPTLPMTGLIVDLVAPDPARLTAVLVTCRLSRIASITEQFHRIIPSDLITQSEP